MLRSMVSLWSSFAVSRAASSSLTFSLRLDISASLSLMTSSAGGPRFFMVLIHRLIHRLLIGVCTYHLFFFFSCVPQHHPAEFINRSCDKDFLGLTLGYLLFISLQASSLFLSLCISGDLSFIPSMKDVSAFDGVKLSASDPRRVEDI